MTESRRWRRGTLGASCAADAAFWRNPTDRRRKSGRRRVDNPASTIKKTDGKK